MEEEERQRQRERAEGLGRFKKVFSCLKSKDVIGPDSFEAILHWIRPLVTIGQYILHKLSMDLQSLSDHVLYHHLPPED